MRAENFIYFSTVSGFFIGVIFAVFKEFGVVEFMLYVALITLLFYLVGLGSAAFFMKFVDVKKVNFFNKSEIDTILDTQIKELERKEESILHNYEFIKKVEDEELKILRKIKS